MKTNFKIIGCVIVTYFIITSCKKTEYDLMPNIDVPDAKNLEEVQSPIDTIIFGNGNLSPLTGTLTNIVSENFESGGQTYYCYQLKLEKLYPAHVYYPNGSSRSGGNNSYSLNFKFFTTLENGPIGEDLNVEFLNDLLLYYKALDRTFAGDKKTIGFLYGDKTLDPDMDGNEYINSLKSQVRIKSGTLHIEKSDELYLVSFSGENETGETIICNFNDTVSVKEDIQIESFEEDFSLNEPQGSYIKKDNRYYKLVDGYYYVFKSAIYQGNPIQTVQVICWRDYYWYEYISGDAFYPDIIGQHWKSNALILQFQFANVSQFSEKTYQVTASDGIYSIGYGLSQLRDIPFKGFPNDSLVIGFYHISTDTPNTFTYDEDPDYMKSQITLKSGQLQVTKNKTDYEFDGSFTDANGGEVQVKMKAIPYPWQFEW